MSLRHLRADQAINLLYIWRDSQDCYNLDYSDRSLASFGQTTYSSRPVRMTSGLEYTFKMAVVDTLIERVFGSNDPTSVVGNYYYELEEILSYADQDHIGLQLHASYMQEITKEILLMLQEEERRMNE